jgi:hypothetical protein
MLNGLSWDWQDNIIAERIQTGMHRFIDGGDWQPDYRYREFKPLIHSYIFWGADDILSVLKLLTDEELKACLFHQPVIADLIADVMVERKRSE